MVYFIKKRPKKGKKQKGCTTERFMPGNAVIMLIFRLKELISVQKKINLVVVGVKRVICKLKSEVLVKLDF